jgi:hypothetical protein
MKSYEVIAGENQPTILRFVTENEEVFFAPATDDNPHYAEYLRYTEWVEAGNDPDEFWTQSEGEI